MISIEFNLLQSFYSLQINNEKFGYISVNKIVIFLTDNKLIADIHITSNLQIC